jgi:hypothetical protein
MRRRILEAVASVLFATSLASGAAADVSSGSDCQPDAVAAGSACLDRYEASVWHVPDPIARNAGLVARIRLGIANRGDLTAGGATLLGDRDDDYAPCQDDGASCGDLFAVSIPSVPPSAFVTWFQAQQACGNSGKRLPTNAEWQIGADGSPDPGPDDGIADCNTTRGSASPTGGRPACRSARGAFDMVGNLGEWVADWMPMSTDCPGWASFSDDSMCLAGANTGKPTPGALLRGGSFLDGSLAGPLCVDGTVEPIRSDASIGFRCARALPEPDLPAQIAAGVAGLALLTRMRRRPC